MKNVLLIDDAALMRNILKRILTPEGYTICGETGDGAEGIEKYKALKPDLVICDIGMPGMNGMECLKHILAFDPSAKVIMCTAQGKENYANEAIKIGAKSYIVKPINAKEVLAVSSRVLDNQKVNYKDLMTDKAAEAGLSQKDVLDFFDTFRSLTGRDMGDSTVDHAYLQEQKDQVNIGASAFLAAKLSLNTINRLLELFNEICK